MAALRRRGAPTASEEAAEPAAPALAAAAGAASPGAAAAAHDAAVAATAGGAARRRPARQRARAVLPRELVPEHYQDPHILGWYRPPGGFRKNLSSLFRLHNETGNVWSHLIGFIIFVCLTAATVHLKPAPLRLGAEALVRLEHKLVTYGKSNVLELLQAVEAWEQRVVRYGQGQLGALEDRLGALEEHVARIGRENLQELSHLGERIRSFGANAGAELAAEITAVETAVHDALAAALEVRWPVSRWPIYVFTAGAMVCLLTSAVCHLFGCCAAHVAAVLWRFDYAGIAVLIVASFFPPVYYGFLCSPWTRLAYLLITSALGLSTLCVTLMSHFQRTEYQTYRALLFVGLGLWGLVPGLHAWVANAGESAFSQALALDLLMGAIYIGGAAIYATRFPERWKPGAFDVAFHSHQLFHVAVVVAACVHYKAVRVLLAWRDATGGCLPPLDSMAAPPGATAPLPM